MTNGSNLNFPVNYAFNLELISDQRSRKRVGAMQARELLLLEGLKAAKGKIEEISDLVKRARSSMEPKNKTISITISEETAVLFDEFMRQNPEVPTRQVGIVLMLSYALGFKKSTSASVDVKPSVNIAELTN